MMQFQKYSAVYCKHQIAGKRHISMLCTVLFECSDGTFSGAVEQFWLLTFVDATIDSYESQQVSNLDLPRVGVIRILIEEGRGCTRTIITRVLEEHGSCHKTFIKFGFNFFNSHRTQMQTHAGQEFRECPQKYWRWSLQYS